MGRARRNSQGGAQGEVLRIRIGGNPNGADGGFNGGGRGGTGLYKSGAGGGATDVRHGGGTRSPTAWLSPAAEAGTERSTSDHLAPTSSTAARAAERPGRPASVRSGTSAAAVGRRAVVAEVAIRVGRPSRRRRSVGPRHRPARSVRAPDQPPQCTYTAACGVGGLHAATEFGGGGGGGWFGGGGGAIDSADKPPNPECGLLVGAGGGGSGFVTPAATATLLEVGVGFGDGHVTINY